MKLKIFGASFFSKTSFLLAFLGLTFFSLIKISFLSRFLSNDINKSLIFLFITFLSVLFFIIFVIKNFKNIKTFSNKYINISYLIISLLIIISSIFSDNFFNSFFGKYTFLQNGAILLSIIGLSYIVLSFLKEYKKKAIRIFYISNLFITIPVILGIILSKFKLILLPNIITYFFESWDIVAISAGLTIVFFSIYYKKLADNTKKKTFSLILIILHLILLTIIPFGDVWYALLIVSLFFLFNNFKKKSFFKNVFFYTTILSLFFSIMYLFSSDGFTAKLITKINTFTNNYSGIDFVFLKPRLGLSLGIFSDQLNKGYVFGTGPSNFYKAWQIEKTQSIINSQYWNQDFYSSYSSFTTLLISIGIISVFAILFFVIKTIYLSYKKLSLYKNDINDFDKKDKAYSYLSFAILIFSFVLFIVYVNTFISLVLLFLAIAFALSDISERKDFNKNIYKYIHLIILIIYSILLLIVLIVSINKFLAYRLSNLAVYNYNNNGNNEELENNLQKASKIFKDDYNYRLLSQAYLLDINNTLNKNENVNQELLLKLINLANLSVEYSQKAIDLDSKEYNNYLSLASANQILISLDKENKETYYNKAKEAYEKAIKLYPKNPSIYLNMAQLDYLLDKKDTVYSNINESLNIKPNYSDAYYLSSQLLSEEKKINEAIGYAIQSIQADQKNINAYLQYGTLILSKEDKTEEDFNQALLAFNTILSIDPNNMLAAYYTALTLIESNQYEKAQEVINLLKKVSPENQNILKLEEMINNKKSK